MNRDHSPLIKVEDAILIDTSYTTVEEVADHIMVILKEKGIIAY